MKIALLGNPNTGKSSVFNMLTGMRQHVGNFPGVTVDKKVGKIQFGNESHELIDFPGTYSIYPRSKDEEVVYKNLCNRDSKDFPDAVLVVVDASNLERNLLLFSQIYDLQLPTILLLNMSDLASRKNIAIDLDQLKKEFPQATIISSNARVKMGKEAILSALSQLSVRTEDYYLDKYQLAEIDQTDLQEVETNMRYALISKTVSKVETQIDKPKSRSEKLDKILVHPVFGYLIFAVILMVIFQFIFEFASVPSDLIDNGFNALSSWLSSGLPNGMFTDLLTEGIIPGIGGVAVFIPQIALLFFFIAILEESGYLSRVVFIMDRLMRPLGLNGKSVVPLMSSVACAIPGVMATRTISDWKERIITIMVSPLMSCSARIPVYTLLIALVIPDKTIGGFMNLQGLVLFGLYALGTISALLIAVLMKYIIRTKKKGFLLLEMPSYKIPKFGNVGLTVLEKIKVFVFDAGKIILAVSIVLWALATFGPSDRMKNAEIEAEQLAKTEQLSEEDANQMIASKKLANSYIGILGKAIEPAIEPIGYDWKIGISLITSFAAREVFVGSMGTIYAVGDDSEVSKPLIEKMRSETNEEGNYVFTLATGCSLMVFYVFAMQCMATLAVVKRETKSWKWPLIQMGYMGVLAYFGAWITFVILS